MKAAVWKYTLPLAPAVPEIDISMPKGATIVHVAAQREDVALWALCNPEAAGESRRFRVVVTGEVFDQTGMLYVGTALLMAGSFVVHVFEKI